MPKVLYLIDANGSYQNGKHSAYSTVTPDFYEQLKKAITSKEYDMVLYRPSIPYGNDEILCEALKTDPILTLLSDEEKNKITIIPNGYGSVSEWNKQRIDMENKLAISGCEFICAGLYRDWCVRASYDDLKSRFPNNKISISYKLTRLSPQGEMERRNEIGMIR